MVQIAKDPTFFLLSLLDFLLVNGLLGRLRWSSNILLTFIADGSLACLLAACGLLGFAASCLLLGLGGRSWGRQLQLGGRLGCLSRLKMKGKESVSPKTSL